MFPGMGRGINPKQVQKQMRALGIDMYDIEDVKQVIIKTGTKEIVFDEVQVTVIDAKGEKMYQVVGAAQERPLMQGEAKPVEPVISEDDIMLVASQAKVPREVAAGALKETKGDLAEAIMKLTGGQ